MPRRYAPKRSLRDAKSDANKWDRYYAMSAGMEPQCQSVIAPKREIVNHSNPEDLEGAVLAEVGEVLSVHQNVIMCVRQNTGAAQMLGKGGKTYPVWFYRWIRRTENMTITDYWGWLRIGPSRVPFALECKRRSWKRNFNKPDENEQHTFIEEMIRMGGRGGFVTSSEQALAILK